MIFRDLPCLCGCLSGPSFIGGGSLFPFLTTPRGITTRHHVGVSQNGEPALGWHYKRETVRKHTHRHILGTDSLFENPSNGTTGFPANRSLKTSPYDSRRIFVGFPKHFGV